MFAIPSITAYFVAMFARDKIAGALGSTWELVCRVVATPLGAALVAGAVCLLVGQGHGHHTGYAKGHAEAVAVRTQWAAANAEADADRERRDAAVKATAEIEAQSLIATANQRMADAEGKLHAYEKTLAARPKNGARGYTADDVRRLRDLTAGNAVAPGVRSGVVRAVGGAGHGP